MGGVARTRWERRAFLAVLVRGAYLCLPLVLSLVASVGLSRMMAVQTLPRLSRWLFVVAVTTVVLTVAHRCLARLLPLAALLEVSVAFPGEAPPRYAVARDAGNTAKLREIVRRAQSGDPVVRADDVQAAREILALVAALRAHDSRTRGHSERVRIFADLIAQEMHLGASSRERLRWAALLHDVGKLQIPAAVLNKPGKLDHAEWDMVRLHPDAGARLTAPLQDWLGSWSRTIPDHHERYDGTGYPRGLAGEDISLGGRILSVADSFEVMTAARSYKKPLSREAALRELRRCSAAQFDPAVVRALLAISAPRLRWAMGPLAWLASTPLALASPAAASTLVMQTGAAALSVSAVAVVAPSADHSTTTHRTSVTAKATPIVAPAGATVEHDGSAGRTKTSSSTHAKPKPKAAGPPATAKPAKVGKAAKAAKAAKPPKLSKHAAALTADKPSQTGSPADAGRRKVHRTKPRV